MEELTRNAKGALAEAEIAAEAVRHGWVVLRPDNEGRRYDLVIDTGPHLLRVQCKWGRLLDDVIVVRTSTSRHTPRGYVSTTYTADEIDVLAVYCGALDRCFALAASDIAGVRQVHLRPGAAKNNQRTGVRMADAHPLGAVAQLGERRAGSAKVRGSSPLSSTGSTKAA